MPSSIVMLMSLSDVNWSIFMIEKRINCLISIVIKFNLIWLSCHVLRQSILYLLLKHAQNVDKSDLLFPKAVLYC